MVMLEVMLDETLLLFYMLHIFCGGTVSITIKHNIAVSEIAIQMSFV